MIGTTERSTATVTRRAGALTNAHATMLQQLAARTGALCSAVADGHQPLGELALLLGYLHGEVLVHAAAEERQDFRTGDPRFVALRRDHLRLRAAVEVLTRAETGEQSLSPARLAAVARDLVAQFERHVHAEERLLRQPPGDNRPTTVIDLDAPQDSRRPACRQ